MPKPTPNWTSDDSGEPTDAELLRRHVDGDSEAFGILFSRHRTRLWAVAVRTIGDGEEAADALQDAMVKAYRAASSFRGKSAVTTWLHRIVVNACLDRLRRNAARPADALPEHFDIPDSRPTPADSTTHMVVREALATLPFDQRAVLVYIDMLGYSVADTAQILQVRAGTVKSRAARARKRLASQLAELGNREGFSRVSPTDDAALGAPRTGQTDTENGAAGPPGEVASGTSEVRKEGKRP
ncbi:RNA polymerase sigma factor SigM [Natronoglycomyces albus]|uniref:RNA polymerase sigma factor SigM n=1 Tax=Natronoglycomyces albus TaxID=2811108 RepID=A0A895XNL5_9ACTN|nr:RNA polymerase sigma factor SigM [Natronoglycomyces albus]QSB05362.1 RNA polymerase sigma factor SigM [Natronoglycomyces albus]